MNILGTAIFRRIFAEENMIQNGKTSNRFQGTV